MLVKITERYKMTKIQQWMHSFKSEWAINGLGKAHMEGHKNGADFIIAFRLKEEVNVAIVEGRLVFDFQF